MNTTYLVVYTLHSRQSPNTFVDKIQAFRADDYSDPKQQAKKFYIDLLDAAVDPAYPDHDLYSISLTEVIESSDY
jgi:hypothetical protein